MRRFTNQNNIQRWLPKKCLFEPLTFDFQRFGFDDCGTELSMDDDSVNLSNNIISLGLAYEELILAVGVELAFQWLV